MKQQTQNFITDQSGAIALATALSLVVLLGVAALAIDYGHMAWVQNELQKAAEAGALAGGRFLTPYVNNPATPDWISAQNMATQTVLKNCADGQPLTDCKVEYGYWSLSTKTLQPPGLVPTNSDLPAIRVTVAKAAGHNGGPLHLLLAPIIGISSHDLSGQAVGAISGPYSVPPGDAFPLAMPKNLLDQYQWEAAPPATIEVGASNTDGLWTSFCEGKSVPTIRELIATGNPTNLKVGDTIYIEPGTMTTLYDDAASKIGQTVIVPVVSADSTSHGYTPILGFASLVIDNAVGGSGKYIQGHFIRQQINNVGSGGPLYGTSAPAAKLVY